MTRLSLFSASILVVALCSCSSVAEGFVGVHPFSNSLIVAASNRQLPKQQQQQHQHRCTDLYFFQFPNLLESLTGGPNNNNANNNGETVKKREILKAALLEECRRSKGSNTFSRKQQRSNMEVIIDELQRLSPTPAAASSPLLQTKWALEWTTEKEVNFFFDFGFSNEIGQTIRGDVLENNIEFVRGGGGFYVVGRLSVPDPSGLRTNFEFETAKLDLGERWGAYEFPPVGSGWFDTVYLDETLRVDVNSRDDILVCTPYPLVL